MINLKKNKKRSKKSFVGTKTYIADMETCGVYFTEEQIKKLEEARLQSLCHYSGLPSPSHYETR